MTYERGLSRTQIRRLRKVLGEKRMAIVAQETSRYGMSFYALSGKGKFDGFIRFMRNWIYQGGAGGFHATRLRRATRNITAPAP